MKLGLITLNRTLLSSYGNFTTYKQDKALEFIICKYNLNMLLDEKNKWSIHDHSETTLY